ncbi:methionyl-tRNA formyltransferase [Chitinophaga oryzae]|uniref:Methionyl-tRNA formyltransferase n=1 Tax=Chitinophaga oryzae TaxID=2725414 RepID=A0AAE7D9R5_9BACT|nr:methionyl-tRNA formyltransferase [Chitinophaga oryzae]QJB34110.1 methionyl-tRNA formyltransferase [Chitinophaga oryzae]QJB40629.1 methionyl-tRNA formyltransferase [Chitinophaga oryzae]
MLEVVFLGSGGLGLDVLKQVWSSYRVKAVLTDKKSVSIISFCNEHQIPCFAGNPRGNKTADFVKDIRCDILLSVNYLFVIEKDLIDLPALFAINIHGSLLPKYRGRTPHVWAIINGETVTGVTVHLIDELVDNGKILKQREVSISPDDTGATILEKFSYLYPSMVQEVLTEIAQEKVTLVEQDNAKATYFGKRTPEDGKIEWSWFKERIRNWIRAQAAPYPGAFAFYEGHKVSIHKATFSDMGFAQDIADGTILATDQQTLHVKTPNGVLQLSDIKAENPITFRINGLLK